MRRDGSSHPKKPSGDAKPGIWCANLGVAVALCALSHQRWALGGGGEGRQSAHQKPPEMFPLLFSPKPPPCWGEEVTPCTALGYICAWTVPRAARVPEQVAASRWLYITPIELPAVSLQIRAEIMEALLMQMNFDRGGGCVRATGVCRAAVRVLGAATISNRAKLRSFPIHPSPFLSFHFLSSHREIRTKGALQRQKALSAYFWVGEIEFVVVLLFPPSLQQRNPKVSYASTA